MPSSASLIPAQPLSHLFSPSQASKSPPCLPHPLIASISLRAPIQNVEHSAYPSSSPLPPSSVGLPPSHSPTRYIHRPSSRFTSLAKNSKPFPVSPPLPATHALEQRPTFSLCIFCRWKRFETRSPEAKVRSVNYGCSQCNIALCRECFPVFHSSTTC